MDRIENCALCGKPAEAYHHLIFGWGMRSLADKDQIGIWLCNACHNMSKDCIHGNIQAERLSKMLGQALWENKAILRAVEAIQDEDFAEYLRSQAREAFRDRYGRSYL